MGNEAEHTRGGGYRVSREFADYREVTMAAKTTKSGSRKTSKKSSSSRKRTSSKRGSLGQSQELRQTQRQEEQTQGSSANGGEGAQLGEIERGQSGKKGQGENRSIVSSQLSIVVRQRRDVVSRICLVSHPRSIVLEADSDVPEGDSLVKPRLGPASFPVGRAGGASHKVRPSTPG